MLFSTTALLAFAGLSVQALAAPTANAVSDAIAIEKRTDIASTMYAAANTMQSSISTSLTSINSSASSGYSGLSGVVSGFENVASAVTTYSNVVTPLLTSNPAVNFTIEEIQVLVEVLQVWSAVLSEVESVVDAVVNTFFPGLTDLFKPFIQIWINVVEGFLAPFFQFYENLVGELTDSPELVQEIKTYIAEIQTIVNNFLLAF